MDELNSGGFGTVYRSNRNTAIKKMIVNDHTIFSSIIKEASILSLLNHPHLVKLLSFSHNGNTNAICSKSKEPFTVEIEMDLWDIDLKTYIGTGLMFPADYSIDDALKLFVQILSAMVFLHSQGIYHHDLKPENVLLRDNNKYAGLCDFGCGSFRAYNHMIDIGSTPCRPPENFSDIPLSKKSAIRKYTGTDLIYDEKTDIFACGILLLYMVSGKTLLYPTDDYEKPFPERSLNYFLKHPLDLIRSYLTKHDSWLGSKKEALVDTIYKMVNPDYTQRIALKEILELPLFLQYRLNLPSTTGTGVLRHNLLMCKNPVAIKSSLEEALKNHFKVILEHRYNFITRDLYIYISTSLDLLLRYIAICGECDKYDFIACFYIVSILYCDNPEILMKIYSIREPKYQKYLFHRCLYVLKAVKCLVVTPNLYRGAMEPVAANIVYKNMSEVSPYINKIVGTLYNPNSCKFNIMDIFKSISG